MSTFLTRVFDALDTFDPCLAQLAASLASAAAPVPANERQQMQEAAAHAGRAATKLRRSFDLIQRTALDIVDMQVRVQGETAQLAGALRELGKTVERVTTRQQQEGRTLLPSGIEDVLVRLDESAQLVAAAVFPSAIGGLRKVNVTLWDFEKILWKRYTDLLTELVQEQRLTNDQQATIERVADGIRDGFDRVNELLNTLAEGAFIEADAVHREVGVARQTLATHLDEARGRMTAAVSMFEPMVKEAAAIARAVDERLAELRIPIFPTHDRLPVAGSV